MGGWKGRLPLPGFAICDRVNEGRRGPLEEVSEESLEPLDQRSVILILENDVLQFGKHKTKI